MAEYLVNDTDMIAVANAIREKSETSESLAFPSEFVTAIQGIKGVGGLNFEVVGGTTEPTDPKANTIWINTDQEITGWSFSSTAPQNPSDGTVWIVTGAESSWAFSATEENTVMIYPLRAKQYVSGKWENQVAKIHQNGEWRYWIVFLVDGGDISDAFGDWMAPEYGGVGGAVSYTSEGIVSTVNQATYGQGGCGWCGPSERIHFADAEKITLVVSNTQSASVRFEGCLTLEKDTMWNSSFIVTKQENVPAGTTKEITIDVPADVEDCYLRFGCSINPQEYNAGRSLLFTKVYW